MRNAGLEETQAGIKIAGRKINNLRYADDTTLMAESEEELNERLLLNHANTPGFLAPRGEEFNPGPETRLDRSELLCNKVLLKYKGDRESF